MFRDRPLTWLFFIATACVDLAMILPTFHAPEVARGDLPRLIFLFGIPAQLSLAAIWAAVGGGHRLARGAMLTLAVFLATLATMRFPYAWQNLLSFYLLQALLVASGSLLLNAGGWLRKWSPRNEQEKQKFQFSVIEMFGWTCLAAIWAFAAHHARMEDDFYGLYLTNSVIVPLAMVALLNCSCVWWFRGFLILLGYAVAILMARFTAGRFDSDADFILLGLNLTQVTYLALWYAVQRLDDAMNVLPAEDMS